MCETLAKEHNRTFVDAWLHDDRLKSWIRKVPFDNTVVHCIVCNKNISCKSYIVRHANTLRHKNNVTKNDSVDNDVNTAKTNKERYRKRFNPRWLEIENFKVWLREHPTNANACYCSICKKTLIGGLSQIKRHAECRKHLDTSKKIITITITNNSNKDVNTKTNPILSFDERKKTAEIKYAALFAEYNIPPYITKEILNFLQEIEKNSHILKYMSMSRTKCRNIISNVLYPVEMECIINNIQNTKFSVLLSIASDTFNEKWMTIFVRYICPETLDVRSQLVKLISINITDCNSENLFNIFQSEIDKLQIPFSNILALTCNNTSVMTGKHLSFKKRLEEKCKDLLTFPCPCHAVALIALTACTKIPLCEQFLKKLFTFIITRSKDSLIYKEFSKCFLDAYYKSLNLCDTRWLSHYSSIEKLLESWERIKFYINEIVITEKSTSGEHLLSMMGNLETKAYFLFFKYILKFFIQFNAFFEVSETRIYLLQSKSIIFLTQICQNFMKPKLLRHMLSTITFSEKKNHKPLKNITLGLECEKYLHNLEGLGHVNLIKTIRQNCLHFYIVVAEEIRKRLPISDIFLEKFQVFQAQVSLFDSDRETSFDDVSFIAKSFDNIDEDILKKEWFALNSDFSIEEKQNLLQQTFDDMWKEICKCQSINDIKYPNLRLLLNAIRSLPNSNFDSERTFSDLSNIKTKKRNRLSPNWINAICVFKSALQTRREAAIDMKVTEKHLALMSASKLYIKSLKKDKNNLTPNTEENVDDVSTPSSSNIM